MAEAERWLITGGAGYIGAHIADAFLLSNKEVVVYDSLYQGLQSRIEYLRQKYDRDLPLIIADIRDLETLSKVIKEYDPIGIVHTAALKSVSESMQKREEYFEINSQATRKLLETASRYGVRKFIFSSSAAVYGSPSNYMAVKEEDQKLPISPYGSSKLAAEFEVNKFLTNPGNYGTSLRFFNVVGTSSNELRDNSKENLVPIVIDKLKIGQRPEIYGIDYSTSDGTCIRDYIDVRDVAHAHLLAADSTKNLPLAMNVGNGQGASVREVIALICKAIGQNDTSVIESGRRAGDPETLCADISLISESVGFSAKYSLKTSIESLFAGKASQDKSE